MRFFSEQSIVLMATIALVANAAPVPFQDTSYSAPDSISYPTQNRKHFRIGTVQPVNTAQIPPDGGVSRIPISAA